MSVLTDEIYFGGTLDDLIIARESCSLPLLRKEFIIDEYQIIEAKAIWSRCYFINCSHFNPRRNQTIFRISKKLKT